MPFVIDMFGLWYGLDAASEHVWDILRGWTVSALISAQAGVHCVEFSGVISPFVTTLICF